MNYFKKFAMLLMLMITSIGSIETTNAEDTTQCPEKPQTQANPCR